MAVEATTKFNKENECAIIEDSPDVCLRTSRAFAFFFRNHRLSDRIFLAFGIYGNQSRSYWYFVSLRSLFFFLFSRFDFISGELADYPLALIYRMKCGITLFPTSISLGDARQRRITFFPFVWWIHLWKGLKEINFESVNGGGKSINLSELSRLFRGSSRIEYDYFVYF